MEGVGVRRREGLRTVSPAAALATACVAVVALSLLWAVPTFLSRAGRLAGESSRLDYADRQVAGGNGVIVSQAALYTARAAIPPHAYYRVAVGDHLPDATSLTKPFAWLYYQYFLMPRRQSPTARWVVCLACDLNQEAPGAAVVWRDDTTKISIAHLPP